ncbi:hypothetical protein [Aquimarina sp. 2201CG5-10]|uniref:hypothetical protein n=1 Tax=Aquimarina callyspongiae TaxID=3098150 RepID=UPI002AB3FC5E|nr:hypothetical protein [Aquimarina sp. 2201CG5-10]MDY8137588.1 hypothetical protein [Aquimarina sp. 2201CG5-10]
MKTTGIELITKERKEQIEIHNRTIEDDKKFNTDYQLSYAGCCLVWTEIDNFLLDCRYRPPTGWGLQSWHNMLDKPYKERLIIAGALIAAEIDRLNH